MLNNKDTVLEQLRQLNLSSDESKLYLELLRGPNTHSRLAHSTGINRTKVYRLADQLEKRSLITTRTDDRGTFLVAADPATLEVQLTTEEERLKAKRTALESLMPVLNSVKNDDSSNFVVHTYEGVEGFKQMLWHELKTKREQLIFGSGRIDDLVDDTRWAEKHRALTVEVGYTIREILNPNTKRSPFTLNKAFISRYIHRRISTDLLPMNNQTTVYNDTVSIYNWRGGQKVGLEIANRDFAQTIRHMFEHYWRLCE